MSNKTPDKRTTDEVLHSFVHNAEYSFRITNEPGTHDSIDIYKLQAALEDATELFCRLLIAKCACVGHEHVDGRHALGGRCMVAGCTCDGFDP